MKTWYNFDQSEKQTELYVYGDIGSWGISAGEFAKDLQAIPMGSEIKLRLSSSGGSVTDGMAMHTLIKERKAQVVCYVDGLAASMASLIMCAASKVVAAAGSWIMIHNVKSGAFGGSSALRQEAEIVDKMTAQLVAAYVEKTGKTEDEIRAAMDAETWFTADEAKAFGLVDEIVGEVSAQACANLSQVDLAKIKAPVALTTFIGDRKASANNNPKSYMKNLLKALADAKMIGSADLTEEAAVAQINAHVTARTASSTEDAAKIKTLETELADLKLKQDESAKTTAEAAVASAVKIGRIKDDADLRSKWVASYVRDPKGTQTMLDSIPEAKAAPGAAPVGNQTPNQNQAPVVTGRARIAAAWGTLKA